MKTLKDYIKEGNNNIMLCKDGGSLMFCGNVDEPLSRLLTLRFQDAPVVEATWSGTYRLLTVDTQTA